MGFMADCCLDASQVFVLSFPIGRPLTTAGSRMGSSCRMLRALVKQKLSQGCCDVLSITSFDSADGSGHREEKGRVRSWDTLRDYPKEELLGQAVLVRLDMSACIDVVNGVAKEAILRVVPTLSYLMSAGSRVVIASHWSALDFSNKTGNNELIADSLSQHLGKRVLTVNAVRGIAVQDAIAALSIGDALLLGNFQRCKDELSNDREFSKELASNIDIFVNDAFSISHRILASTVGVACFTKARLADRRSTTFTDSQSPA